MLAAGHSDAFAVVVVLMRVDVVSISDLVDEDDVVVVVVVVLGVTLQLSDVPNVSRTSPVSLRPLQMKFPALAYEYTY